MDLYKQLLERMASISPAVRVHLGGNQWRIHIDEDEVTPMILVSECLSMMVDEVFELGVEFFCAREELCENLYHLDKTLLLFEVIYPTPLYRSITEDDSFKRWLSSIVYDGAGDQDYTTITNILQYLAMEHPHAQDTFYDTYVFLQDKIRSTPVFDIYVKSILGADNTPMSTPVDPQVVVPYLNSIQEKFSKLLRATDVLSRSIPSAPIQYTRLHIFKNNAIKPDTVENNIWVYQTLQQTTIPYTPAEQVLLVRIIREFESTTPLFEEYFKLIGSPITQDDIISIVLGCFIKTTTKKAFAASVDSTFQRLDKLLPGLQVQVLIQTVCLTLIKEFYP